MNGPRRVMSISHVHCTMDLSWKQYVYFRQTKGRLDITRSSGFILELYPINGMTIGPVLPGPWIDTRDSLVTNW